ncbi:MAG: universal stress protein [Chloroflexi bacterium]|nr:universal stress protein [Chloroflexota bacterium]
MNAADAPARLIVALDGSRLAEAVLPLVRSLAVCLGAEVTLFHSLESEPPPTVHGEPHLSTVPEAEAYLAGIAHRLHGAGAPGGHPVATHVHTDPTREVASGIADHASELNADIVILAAHGRGGVKEWLAGRIPQQVVARAGRPVLIVPTPLDRDRSAIRRILLPVDPAGEAAAAMPLAQRIGAGCRSGMVLLTVIPTAKTMPGEAGVATIFLPHAAASLLDWVEEEMRARLERLGESLRKAGLAVATEVRRGDPAAQILAVLRRKDEALSEGPDLVIMATHARAGLDGLLAGSVTPRVVGASPCPLLLVPLGS